MTLPAVSPKLWNKSSNSLIYDIMISCTDTSVTHHKNGRCQERCHSCKRNNMSKNVRCWNYYLHSLSWGKQQKNKRAETRNHDNSTWMSMFVWVQRQNGMSVSCKFISLHEQQKLMFSTGCILTYSISHMGAMSSQTPRKEKMQWL
jgi:hypothetical protein